MMTKMMMKNEHPKRASSTAGSNKSTYRILTCVDTVQYIGLYSITTSSPMFHYITWHRDKGSLQIVVCKGKSMESPFGWISVLCLQTFSLSMEFSFASAEGLPELKLSCML